MQLCYTEAIYQTKYHADHNRKQQRHPQRQRLRNALIHAGRICYALQQRCGNSRAAAEDTPSRKVRTGKHNHAGNAQREDTSRRCLRQNFPHIVD